MAWSKEEYRELLEDLVCEYCEPKKYCIFKEFLISLHPSPRILMQLKAIDKFKFEKGKELDREVNWAEAMQMWVDEGYAKKFSDMYEEGINFSTLYKKIRNGKSPK